MTDIPLLLDQNMEPEVRHRLKNYGHTVEHILTHDTLQRGTPDRKLAEYSLNREVIILIRSFVTLYRHGDRKRGLHSLKRRDM